MGKSRCAKCKKEFDFSLYVPQYWTKEDEKERGWNKAGTLKEYTYRCKCGFKNGMIPM